VKYLILGSAGQIGAPLTAFLQKQGHEVLEVDIVNSPETQDLRQPDLEIHPEHWSKKIEEADFVFFLAFDVGGSVYLSKYQHTFDFLHNNVGIMYNVFEELQRRNKPFVFASSQMSNMSYSPYGVAKAIGECYTRTLNGIVVKFWNVYGYERDLNKSHVITDFILKAQKTGVIDMMTSGQEVRQFLYAEDCARALLRVSELYSILPRDKEYHITNFQWSSVKEVADLIADMVGGGVKVVPAKAIDSVQLDKRNEPDPYILNIWQPTTSLSQGLRLVMDEMKEHSK